jgi:hypothetical protein
MAASTPLIIGETQKRELRVLRERAALEPVDVLEVLELIKTPEGEREHRDRMTVLSIPLPLAFLVTFSIETGHPAGTCRHMSMSSLRRGRLPIPEAVWMVCEELGFVGSLQACRTWVEDLPDGEKAINVVQPVAVLAGATA